MDAGIFDENGTIKTYLSDLVIDCTKGRTTIDPDGPVTPRPVDTPPNPTMPPVAVAPVTTPIVVAPVTRPTAPFVTPATIGTAPAPSPNAPVTAAIPTTVIATPTTAVSPVQYPTTAVVTPTTTGGAPAPAPIFIPSLFTSPHNNDNADDSTSCEQRNACDALGLTGQCCPTTDGWTLDCCTPSDQTVEVQCKGNPVCAEMGLADACCPTRDGLYLDCCASVPDDCQAPGACQVVSALEYNALNGDGVQVSAATSSWSATTNQVPERLFRLFAGASIITTLPFYLC